MKVLKIILGLVVVLVLVAVVGVYFLAKNINGIVEHAVETVGSDITQTQVGLGKADIKLDLKESRGELDNLTVANPKGFSKANLLTIGQVALGIEPLSISKDVIVINEVTIKGVNILAEHKGVKDTNLQALLNNIKAKAGAGGSTEATTDDSGKEVLLAMKKIVFADNSVDLKSEKAGNYQLKIPAFELQNLGSAEKGLTPTQLAEAAIKPLVAKAQAAVEEKLKDELEDKAKEKLLENLDDDQKEKLEGIKSLLKKDKE